MDGIVQHLHEQIAALRRKCHAYYMKERRMKDLRKTVDDLKKEKQQLVEQHRLEIATKITARQKEDQFRSKLEEHEDQVRSNFHKHKRRSTQLEKSHKTAKITHND